MADQATSAGGRSSIGPHPETPAEGAPASMNAPADQAPAMGANTQVSSVQQATSDHETVAETASPGFGERGRMRRRLRFLRKARELAYRDLGGLVFEMQRLGERHDDLAAGKLATLAAIDTELRALEDTLTDRRPLTILRESGIAACPRCAAIHGSDDRFCPSCGLAMESRADRPIAAVAPTVGPAAGAGLPGATPTTAMAPRAPASPAPAAPGAPSAAPPSAAPPSAAPPSAAPPSAAPPFAAPPSVPGAQRAAAPRAPEPVTDERPTEIIRPADKSPREDT